MLARTEKETSTILRDHYKAVNDIAAVPSPFTKEEIAAYEAKGTSPPSTRHAPKEAFEQLIHESNKHLNLPEELPLFRSYFQSALTFAYVEVLLKHYAEQHIVHFIETLDELNVNAEGMHATVNATVEMGFPGHFTHHCHDYYVKTGEKLTFTPYLTRFTPNRHLEDKWCHSNIITRDICMYDFVDMGYAVEVPHFLVNKMSPSKYGYGVYSCWMEMMEKRAKDHKAHTRRSPSVVVPEEAFSLITLDCYSLPTPREAPGYL
jgi:hypothetical protein